MSRQWETTTIGTLFEIGAGKSVTPVARKGEPKYPFLRTANIFWGKVDTSQVDSMFFTPEEIRKKNLTRGDLLVCEGGDIGRSAIWNEELKQCSFQNHLHRLRTKKKDVLPRFYMYYLQAGFTQLSLYEGAGNKTTIPNLSKNRLADLQVPHLPLPEQQKIAAILWKIQQAIEMQEKLIGTTKELKQTAMQQLFTKGLRGEKQKETEIGPVPESWEVQKLETLREFLQYGTSSKCDYLKKGNPVIRIPNVADGRVNFQDLKWCVLSNKEVNSWILEEGDVLFIRTNGVRERVGTCAVYCNEPQQALFASYLIRARLKREKLDSYYLQYFTSTARGSSSLSGSASPAADGKFNINMTTIDSVLVPLPKIEEQLTIVSFLRKIDEKIALHKCKHATLQELFQSLLQQLMTGQIRVADLKIDIPNVI